MSSLPQLQPYDDHNQRLQSNVAPSDWQNPTPTGRYNLVVLGAGTAGLVTAAGAAGMGAKVALIERELMGGDCLNVGCVPSKGVIAAARIAAGVARANRFGVSASISEVNFGDLMERMRRLRADISPADSAARFRDLGVDVFLGNAKFKDNETVVVDGSELKFRKAVIATGCRASAPPIPGIDDVEFLTNETVFSLEKLPRRFGVVGAGPIGCEMAQSFAQLGSEVHLFEATHGILPREDADAASIVKESIETDGVKLYCCGKEMRLRQDGDEIHVSVQSHETSFDVVVDELLVAVGRAPNVAGIGLEKVGVDFDEHTGIKVSDQLRTSNSNIFAAGDVCSQYKFTHAADFMARIVIQNALFKGRAKASNLIIPWATYTSPEIAHVGLYPREAESQGIEIDTYTQEFADVDRAILSGETEGFVKIHTAKGKDRILGATIVAPHAGDMISEITLAIKNNIGLKSIASVIHPYPTQAEAIRKIGDQFNRTRLTPFVKNLFKRWLAFQRGK